MKQALLTILLLTGFWGQAQESRGVTFQADLLSRHYWRGFAFGTSPCIEPQVTFYSGKFSFDLWAANTIDESYTEIDLIPTFTTGNFTFSLYDYYNPVPGQVNRFFDFSKDGNRHSVELTAKYNGKGKFPLSWMVGTFLLGDRHPANRDPMFSTYLQGGYPFQWCGAHLEVSAGLSPWESYYSERFALVHAGISVADRIRVGERLFIPLKMAFNTNPSRSQAYAIFSIGIVKE